MVPPHVLPIVAAAAALKAISWIFLAVSVCVFKAKHNRLPSSAALPGKARHSLNLVRPIQGLVFEFLAHLPVGHDLEISGVRTSGDLAVNWLNNILQENTFH